MTLNKKVKKFHVLKCWMFNPKNKTKILAVNLKKNLDLDLDPHYPKMLDQDSGSALKPMRIRKTDYNS
jgi:hypothetical protein